VRRLLVGSANGLTQSRSGQCLALAHDSNARAKAAAVSGACPAINLNHMNPFTRSARDRQDSTEDRIREVLAGLHDLLGLDQCGLELISFERATGTLVLRLEGSCPHCDMSAATLLRGIETHLRMRVPEVREVRAFEEANRDG
jgi:Fe-S cluster biogenesis protein NfuA